MAEEQKKGGALAAFVGAGALAVNESAAVAALAESVGSNAGPGGDTKYLSFSGKTGSYSLGREKDDVDPDDVFIVEPLASTEGWTCWKGGSAVAKHEWPVSERRTKAVPASQLIDHGPYNERAGEGWAFALGLGLIHPDDPEVPIKFTTTSKSGCNVVSDLNRYIVGQFEETGRLMLPLVQLSTEMFTAQGQRNYKPKIDIVAWVTREEVAAFFDDSDGTIDDLIEGAYAGGAPAMEAEPEPEPERAPRRARRPAA